MTSRAVKEHVDAARVLCHRGARGAALHSVINAAGLIRANAFDLGELSTPCSMDWFKGTFTGKPHRKNGKIDGFRCRFSPTNQSIDMWG